jgi:hypothetical protein
VYRHRLMRNIDYPLHGGVRSRTALIFRIAAFLRR